MSLPQRKQEQTVQQQQEIPGRKKTPEEIMRDWDATEMSQYPPTQMGDPLFDQHGKIRESNADPKTWGF